MFNEIHTKENIDYNIKATTNIRNADRKEMGILKINRSQMKILKSKLDYIKKWCYYQNRTYIRFPLYIHIS